MKGIYLVLGDRYGLVHLYHFTKGDSQEIWESKQLSGTIQEVIVGDLSGDGITDSFLAYTNTGMIYAWDSSTFCLKYESLETDFYEIYTFTLGNMDNDPATEIVVNADRHLYYIDGKSFKREWKCLQEYQATRMRCADVDGDGIIDIVLNTGEIVDSKNPNHSTLLTIVLSFRPRSVSRSDTRDNIRSIHNFTWAPLHTRAPCHVISDAKVMILPHQH